jgi:aspartate/methionine/tyrosine aminotransferase
VRFDEVPSIALERRLAGTDVLALKGTTAAPLPPHVREAAAAALDEHAVTPPSRGHAALREAIARSLPAPADPEREILVTNGAMHALGLAFRALLEPGDEVIVPTPCYFFAGLIERAGGVFVPVPSREEDGWRWGSAAIEAAVTARTRLLMLTNPNNPTGYLPTRPEMDRLLALASRHNLLVITDEAYERCIHEGVLASAWGAPHVILIRSLGKSLAMPNWRIGFVAGEAALIDACLRELEWDVLRVSHVVQRAATAALEGPQDWLAGRREQDTRDRDAAYAAVTEAGLSCALPLATPFLFPQLRGVDADWLLAARIPVVPGSAFGAPGYARLPFGGAAELAAELRGALQLVADQAQSRSSSAR